MKNLQNLRRCGISIFLMFTLFFSTSFVIAQPVNAATGSWGFVGEGWYRLYPKCASNKCLDVSGGSKSDGANIQIYQQNSTVAQRFYFTPLGNGFYVISNWDSDKVLDVKGGNKGSGTTVNQWTYNCGKNQVWKVVDAGNGYYYLKPAYNLNLALDVSGASSKDGANVQVWNFSQNNSAQMWKFWRGTTTKQHRGISSVTSLYTNYWQSYKVQTVNTNGSSKVTIRAYNINAFSINQPIYWNESNSKISVIIKNSNGKVLYNKTLSGKSNTIQVNNCNSYTVYVQKCGDWLDNIYWTPNLGNYCQLSFTNARTA